MLHRVGRAILRVAVVAAMVSVAAGSSVAAQSSPSMTSVRSELAAVLLQSKKYDQAAREYRGLLSRDTANFEYRLGLARALAWGNQPRAAERELRALRARHVEIATVDSLLRLVRDAMDPTSLEAASWVAERSTYAPYRLALARALVKERLIHAAAAQYDTLLQGTALGPMPEPVVLLRERARAYVDGTDAVRGAAALRDLLRETPGDTAARHELAVLLAAGPSKGDARAQYDTLIARAPTAVLFTERGRLRLTAGDTSGAESDLLASVHAGGTVVSYLMLGDLYRERGDYVPARAMYGVALSSSHGQLDDRMAVVAEIAELTREERPVLAFVPSVGDDPGWRVSSGGSGDNLGVRFASTTLQRTLPLGDAARAGVAVTHQYLGERSAVRSIDLSAVGVEGSLSGQFAYGQFLGRAAVSGGGLHLPASQTIPVGSATLAAWLVAWEAALQVSTDAAYPSLLTTTAVRPLTGTGDALTEHSTTGAVGGPLGSADIAATAQQTRLSDGNTRKTLEGYLRYPLVSDLYAVYGVSRVSFAARSPRYWDPIAYVAQGVGLELSTHSVRGLSAALRALPGEAWSTEAPPPPAARTSRRPTVSSPIDRRVFQLATGGELTWRDPHWETTAAVSYGTGRTGEYRRAGVNLGVRILP